MRSKTFLFLTGCLVVLCAWRFHDSLSRFAAAVVFSEALLMLMWIDFNTGRLPDILTLGLLWLGLIANSFSLFVPLKDSVWGAVAGYLILYAIYQAYKMLTKKAGMGYGDFKLLAALGAWLGVLAIPDLLLASATLTLLMFALCRTKKGWHPQSKIPFGPGLAIAGLLLLLLFQSDRHIL